MSILPVYSGASTVSLRASHSQAASHNRSQQARKLDLSLRHFIVAVVVFYQTMATVTTAMEEYLVQLTRESDATHAHLSRNISKQYGVSVSLRILQRHRRTRNARYIPLDGELDRVIADVQSDHQERVGGQVMLEYARSRNPDWHIAQHRIRERLRVLNPNAVQVRRELHLHPRAYSSFGPNHVWHIDQYDKLKPYFPIHGCVDGYSRKVLWLCVVPSNNNPHNVVELYLDQVARVGGCPLVTRTDRGNENELIAAMQRFFRAFQTDTDRAYVSHRWGSSTSNQRIEANWSRFRRGGGGQWIDVLDRLRQRGYLDDSDPDPRVRHIFQIMCLPILNEWIAEWVTVWNRHRIRRSTNNMVPGKPIQLYVDPILPATECLQLVTDNQIAIARQTTVSDQSNISQFMTDRERTDAQAEIDLYLLFKGMTVADIDKHNWEPIFKEFMRHRLNEQLRRSPPGSPAVLDNADDEN